MRCGQESFGLMIIIGAAIMLFIMISSVINQDAKSAVNIKSLIGLRSVAEAVAQGINIAFLGGPGTEINLSLEELSFDYQIIVKPYNVVINHSDGSFTQPTNTNFVNETIITSNELMIQNKEGLIIVK